MPDDKLTNLGLLSIYARITTLSMSLWIAGILLKVSDSLLACASRLTKISENILASTGLR